MLLFSRVRFGALVRGVHSRMHEYHVIGGLSEKGGASVSHSRGSGCSLIFGFSVYFLHVSTYLKSIQICIILLRSHYDHRFTQIERRKGYRGSAS
jgi:hypothetical protein